MDVNVTEQFSVWVQGGYSSYEDDIGMYGNWGGDWSVWGGAKFTATDKATFNIQGAYEDWGKTAIAANVAYQLVPGFTITPEINYTVGTAIIRSARMARSKTKMHSAASSASSVRSNLNYA